MRKLYLQLFSLLSLISCPAAFANDAKSWYPYPESDTVEEQEWLFFGVMAMVGIILVLGIYYSRKDTKKPDDE